LLAEISGAFSASRPCYIVAPERSRMMRTLSSDMGQIKLRELIEAVRK
jgi:hypothetical protein